MTDSPAGSRKNGGRFFFFLSSFLFIRFVSQEEASCCQGGQLNEAVGEMKGGGSACREVDRREFPPICFAVFHVLSGTVSRAGAALRLCTFTNACCSSHKHSKATRELRTGEIICAVLPPACFLSFSHFFPLFLSLCLSPAVTRSNP